MNQIPAPPKFKETRDKDVLNLSWPKHIPHRCPHCHTSLTRRVNLFHSRSKLSARLHAFAPWLSVIILLSALILIFGMFPYFKFEGGRGTPMAFVAIIVGPPVILTILSNCIKKVHKLQCHHCGHTKDFPIKN
ncbi:MAG: hypothetical protein ACSHX6_03950 [Akkermansiaceae bacterium]